MQGWNPITPSVWEPQIINFISNCQQEIAQNIYSIYLHTELYQRKILIKLFMQYGYEYLSTKSHPRSAVGVGVMVAS